MNGVFSHFYIDFLPLTYLTHSEWNGSPHFGCTICFRNKNISVHLRVFGINFAWSKLNFGIVPKDRFLQAWVYRLCFMFYYLWSVLNVHSTAQGAERMCQKRTRKRKESRVCLWGIYRSEFTWLLLAFKHSCGISLWLTSLICIQTYIIFKMVSFRGGVCLSIICS